MQLPTELFQLEQLRTLAGLAAAIYLVVTVIREFSPSVPAKTVAFGVGAVLSVVVSLLSEQLTANTLLLAVLNGFLAALVATGGSVIVETFMVGPRSQGGITRWWHSWR
jgi:hypothetical protein